MAAPMKFAAKRAAQKARRQGSSDASIKWFGEQVQRDVRIGMTARVAWAAQTLRDRVVININDPVRRYTGPRSGRVQVDPTSRSKPGEFPKADTTRLRTDIFWQREVRSGSPSAIVGTTLDYGLRLELHMNRSFLRRTMNDFLPRIKQILTVGHGDRDFPNNNL